MCKKILFFVSFLVPLIAFATHQRAGEITYEHISGFTYRFTIITYTYTPSDADRPELEFSWGDGTTTIVQRYSKVNIANDISINTYITEHTFPPRERFPLHWKMRIEMPELSIFPTLSIFRFLLKLP